MRWKTKVVEIQVCDQMRDVSCRDFGGKAVWGAAKDGGRFAEDLEIKPCLC